jgi:hypothetical protein
MDDTLLPKRARYILAVGDMLKRKSQELNGVIAITHSFDIGIHQYDDGYSLFFRDLPVLASKRFFFKGVKFQGIEKLMRSISDDFPLTSKDFIYDLTTFVCTSYGTVSGLSTL